MIKLESHYKKIFSWYIALSVAALPAIFFQINVFMVHTIIFALLSLGLITLYQAVCLYKVIPGHISLPVVLGSIIVVVGGSVIDMTATVMSSPDLSEEGNPLLLTMLYHHFSLEAIYLFTLLYQIMKVGITLSLWGSFLKIYPQIVKSIPYVSFITTIKWLLGAANMSFSDFVLNKNIQFYFLVPSVSLIMFFFYFIHWYFAMEWFGLAPWIAETNQLAFCVAFFSLIMLSLVTHIKIRINHKKKAMTF